MGEASTIEDGIQKQSRVGKAPVAIPAGVQVTLSGNTASFKGPKGSLTHTLHDAVEVKQEGGQLYVTPLGEKGNQFQGLTRSILRNAIQGVSEGYKISLDLHGVGYRAELKGNELHMALGLSHQIRFPLPDSVKARIETIDEAGVKRPRVHLESHDKMLLGQVAARLRSFRPPEPYKGKGVRYTGERIREKAGKAGGK